MGKPSLSMPLVGIYLITIPATIILCEEISMGFCKLNKLWGDGLEAWLEGDTA